MNQENTENKESITPSKKAKTPYRGFTRSERLVPSILLSLAIPFTIFFFGPFEAICKNSEMLDFTFMDLFIPSFFISLAVAAALFLIVWNLSGRVFDIVYAILFGIGFMLYLQGNYLNLGLNAVEGDGVGVSSYGGTAMIINLIIWIAVIAAALVSVILIRKKREVVRLAMIVAMVAVVGVQVMMFTLLSFTTDAWTPLNQRYDNSSEASEAGDYLPSILTNANLTELSSEGNVIWFVVDRFDHTYFQKMMKTDPTFFDHLDGFTLYDNHITKYARTFPSIAYMLTGIENDYSTGRIEYFENAYTNGTFLKELKDNGYKVNVYTEKYYAYHDANVFNGVVDNLSSSDVYEVRDRMGLWGDMTRLTLFRYLPFFAKGWVGVINTSDFNGYIEYEANKPLFDSGMKDVYDWMTAEDFTTFEGNKNFSFIHINGCHMPNSYYEDFSLVLNENDKWDSNLAMRVSFKLVNYYIDQLKELGLYEDATIIITGDHASAISDTKDLSGSRVTSLMVKKKGESGTPMAVNSAPVEQGQLLASIFQSEGITPMNDYGTSIFEVQEGDDVKRYYHFQKTVSGGDDVLVIYEVVGDAKDFKNWTKLEEINVGNLYK
ncbi:MAG: sulfatase-like hydrolase/transferase [Clostridia bacterium]|nr:sulfatase-like hydrolase/transferase [Clostridia bacterium]